MVKFIVPLLLLAGCAGAYSIDSSQLDFTPHDEDVAAPAEELSQRVLYIAPDEQLAPYMQEVIDRYARLGFNVAVSADGIPLRISEDIPEGAQGLSHYKHWCFYDGCTAASVDIRILPSDLQDDRGFLVNCIIHEVGHIISGWGACAEHLPMADAMHLVPGNLMSNGNTGYASFHFTYEDLNLLNSCVFNHG